MANEIFDDDSLVGCHLLFGSSAAKRLVKRTDVCLVTVSVIRLFGLVASHCVTVMAIFFWLTYRCLVLFRCSNFGVFHAPCPYLGLETDSGNDLSLCDWLACCLEGPRSLLRLVRKEGEADLVHKQSHHGRRLGLGLFHQPGTGSGGLHHEHQRGQDRIDVEEQTPRAALLETWQGHGLPGGRWLVLLGASVVLRYPTRCNGFTC